MRAGLPHAAGWRAAGQGRRLGRIRLRPFETADLPAVAPWFEDPDTRRWLGDRAWPEQLLRLAGASSDRFALLCCDGDHPLALLDVEVFTDGRTAVALVVDPDERQRGIGTAALASLVGRVEVFGGVEEGNVASERLLRRAGFAQATETPDEEGFTYFVRRADGRAPAQPWRRPQT